MTVQETLNALGSWEIDLLPTIPREKLDALLPFGHVAIIHGRVDPSVYGDGLLTTARYVGVLRTNSLADDARTKIPNDNVKIGGVGMAMWLGDQDNKGDVIENATVFASGSLFPNVIRALLPASGAITEGTLYSVPGTYSGTHQWQSPREAIQYVCTTMSTTGVPVSWRVNGNGTLDAGPESSLFVTTPQCTIVARGDGEDMSMRGIPGSMDLDSDVEDYTTRVVLLAEGTGASVATGAADLAPGSNPYKDIHGNPLKLTRLVSESDTTAPNASTRAALALAQYTSLHQDLRLSIQDYDVSGSFTVGDYVYAYDPDKGLVDPAVEVVFRGQRLNPIKLQALEVQWPVTADYTVAYRAADGTWIDLTDHIEINDAGTYVTVGGLSRQLNAGEPVGSRPNQDTSVPGVPVFVTPFTGAAYLDGRGFTRSRVRLQWNAPLNTDGSSILDGDHYEIRYAVDTDMVYPATWSQVSQVRWQDLQIWRQPFAAPTGQWQTMVVGWDQATAQLQDLSPGVGYDVQIRAVDSAGNKGSWSSTTTFVATQDNIPPSTPAAPSVAASRIAVQVTHTLGTAAGGTYNLESDLDHLEVYGDYEPTFTPSDSNRLGKVKATAGMIQAQIPVVATFTIESTSPVYVRVVAVDIAGNRSGPSDAASATALLIDDAHISDLTVSKVTAGTISASWVMAGEIKTADIGARVRLSSDGIELYNASGARTLFGSAADGSVLMVGQLRSDISDGSALVINPPDASGPEIRLFSSDGSKYALIRAMDEASIAGDDATMSLRSSTDSDDIFSAVGLRQVGARIGLSRVTGGFLLNAGGYLDTSRVQSQIGVQDEAAGIVYGQVTAGNSAMRAGWKPGLSGQNSYYADATSLRMYGNFVNASAIFAGGDEAVICGGGTIGASATSDSHVYSATAVNTPRPLLTLNQATVRALGLTANSTAGFTATVASAVASTSPYNFWVFQTV